MRISIRKLHHIHFINAWIISAICIHNFALKFEPVSGYEGDEFFDEGRNLMAEEREEQQGVLDTASFDIGLREGKARREELKKALFESRKF